ncbi:MAG: metal-dependent transcriptional regulator [Promethearchaeota archaeon]|nr:MAG: metal-dependent transcriptional regulator [Candidatus Lokiarchaeota archaeon]
MAKKIQKEISKISDIPESYQRYLDEIYSISRTKKGGWVTNKEIAENLQVEPASVTGMLEKLKSNGLINWEPRKNIRLTEEGKRIARQLNEIHTLLYQFFANVLKIEDQEVIENLSCEIEHHITRDVKDSLEEFLSKYMDG